MQFSVLHVCLTHRIGVSLGPALRLRWLEVALGHIAFLSSARDGHVHVLHVHGHLVGTGSGCGGAGIAPVPGTGEEVRKLAGPTAGRS